MSPSDAPPPPPEAGWAYFLDVDGTLVDIAPTPAEVCLRRELREAVHRLYEATGGAVALVSGRSIADVDAIVGASRFPAAGQHGLERRDALGTVTRRDVPLDGLHAAREQLAEIAHRYPGLLLEDKGMSLALHYRLAPALASFAHRAMRAARARAGPGHVVRRGKRVVELQAGVTDKGEAVRAFMEEEPFRGRLPVFVGDDRTDEDGFAVVNAWPGGGHSVKVGAGTTAARWRLPGVHAVGEWLDALRTTVAMTGRGAARP